MICTEVQRSNSRSKPHTFVDGTVDITSISNEDSKAGIGRSSEYIIGNGVIDLSRRTTMNCDATSCLVVLMSPICAVSLKQCRDPCIQLSRFSNFGSRRKCLLTKEGACFSQSGMAIVGCSRLRVDQPITPFHHLTYFFPIDLLVFHPERYPTALPDIRSQIKARVF